MTWKRLLHRWFIEYNPLYLLSAALVLRGVNLVSNALLERGHALAVLGGPAIAELYAWTLIGGAAVLMRVGLRRPAVILSMLAVVYQGDLTLHTETCAYLGGIGWFASAAWLASFALKLVALARAMRLRVSPSAFAVAIFGATGLVLAPRVVAHEGAHVASIALATWAFALFAFGLHASRRIESRISLDTWGETVLRRALTTTWAIWTALATLHLLFWFSMRHLEPAALLPVPIVLLSRFVPRDARAIALAAAATLFIALVDPSFVALAAALSALAFAIRALRGARNGMHVAPRVVALLSFAYAAVWLASYSGGALPVHGVALDGAFAGALAFSAWKLRAPVALGPLFAALGHHAIQARVVAAPVTGLEWGMWSVGGGFMILLATITASIALHLRAMRESPPH